MTYEFKLQLTDQVTGKALSCDGKFKVVAAGTATPVTLTDALEAAITQPGTIDNGSILFRVPETIEDVDVYIYTDTGYAPVVLGLNFSAQTREVLIDTDNLYQTIQIPMRVGVAYDGADATALDTGFDIATNVHVLPNGVGIRVVTLDATETVEVGILAGESGGDADGFIDAMALDNAGTFIAGVTVTTGVVAASPTRGALLADHADGTNTDDRGIHQTKAFRCNGTAKSIVTTFTTGSDTAAIIILLPTILPKVVRD